MTAKLLERRRLLKGGLAGAVVAMQPGASLIRLASAASADDPAPPLSFPVATISVGTARVDMTPSLPSPFDLGLLEIADNVRQPLYARMVYLESEGQRVLLVTTDTEGILRTAYDAIRQVIAQNTDLAPWQIVINSSHTHRGLWYNLDDEALLSKSGLHLIGMESFQALLTRMAQGAKQAIRSKQFAVLAVGNGQMPELAWNRRLLYLSEYHERRFNPRRKFPIGTTDPTLGVIKAETPDGKALAVLCFYACHATITEPGLSGDWPGFAMGALEREMGPGCTCLFFQGCAGNVTPNIRLQGQGGTSASVHTVGASFAARVQQILLNSMEQIKATSFVFRHAEYELPLVPLSYAPQAVGSVPLERWFQPPPLVAARVPHSIDDLRRRLDEATRAFDRSLLSSRNTSAKDQNWSIIAMADRLTLAENLQEWRRHEVRVLACGPLCLVFLPGETFVDYALEIKQNSSYRYTFVSAYNDLTISYVPDPIAFEEGGYETGPWCYSTPETGGVLVSESLKLIRSLPQLSA